MRYGDVVNAVCFQFFLVERPMAIIFFAALSVLCFKKLRTLDGLVKM
jgi:hypothetical protein